MSSATAGLPFNTEKTDSVANPSAETVWNWHTGSLLVHEEPQELHGRLRIGRSIQGGAPLAQNALGLENGEQSGRGWLFARRAIWL